MAWPAAARGLRSPSRVRARWLFALFGGYLAFVLVYWALGGGARIDTTPRAARNVASGQWTGLDPPRALGRGARVFEAEGYFASSPTNALVSDAEAAGGKAIEQTAHVISGVLIRRTRKRLPGGRYKVWARARVTAAAAHGNLVALFKTQEYNRSGFLATIGSGVYAWYDLGTVYHASRGEYFQVNGWLSGPEREDAAVRVDRVALIPVRQPRPAKPPPPRRAG